MTEHRITLNWTDGGKPFTYDAYPREHTISFKNSRQVVTASASPAYKGDGIHADPEDLLVAALSSCHMLSFLAICTKKKVTVKSYRDEAVGFLEGDKAKLWIARVILRPQVESDATPEALAEIHHLAHEACFIANSVKTDVRVEPQP
jgi:organic hydroperoxide reductase OsmC/OhrA